MCSRVNTRSGKCLVGKMSGRGSVGRGIVQSGNCPRIISGPYFPAFGLNTEKYGPEITPHLDNFHAVYNHLFIYILLTKQKSFSFSK